MAFNFLSVAFVLTVIIKTKYNTVDVRSLT